LVSQPLAFRALEQVFSPLLIVNTKGNPIVIPEIEFSKVAFKVVMGAVLVNTLHSALEESHRHPGPPPGHAQRSCAEG